jgi:glyoxylase-like metal-dependent hydrolase (beta-lactamase superfamily II)
MGDHPWWSRDDKQQSVSEVVCWYPWPEQIKSIKKLRDFAFEWVLPGHGQKVNLPSDAMLKESTMMICRIQSGA